MTIYNFFLTKHLDVEVSITDRPDCTFIGTRDLSTAQMMDYLEIMQATIDACGDHEIIEIEVADDIIAHTNKPKPKPKPNQDLN